MFSHSTAKKECVEIARGESKQQFVLTMLDFMKGTRLSMGKDRTKYIKASSLKEQAYDELEKMLSFGESKREAKFNDTMSDKIFSKNTYQTYRKHIGYFCDWIKVNHPDVTKLKNAKQYVNEWLEYRTNTCRTAQGERLSAWTIQTEAAALNKLYKIDKADENRFQPPQRKREDIKRSRGTKTRDRHFSIQNNEELINFCKGTGLRRNVLEKITAKDLYTKTDLEKIVINGIDKRKLENAKECLANFKDQDFFVFSHKDKGGKDRFSPIMGPHKNEIIARFKSTAPGKKVWEHVSEFCDVHGYRSDYAGLIYKTYARNIEDIPYDKINKGTGRAYRSAKEVYVCRVTEAGKVLDRRAVLKVSKALGHNREDTAITNYIRNI